MGVSDPYLKIIHTIQFKLVLYTCWVSNQKWFDFGWPWPNFGPLVAKELATVGCHKMTENGGFRPSSEKSIHAITFKFGVYTYWVYVQNWLTFWPRWPNCCPEVAKKYFKMYSRNPFQTSCVHSLGECSELICFRLCWPNVSPLVAKKTLEMVVSDHYLKKYYYMEQWLLDLFQTSDSRHIVEMKKILEKSVLALDIILA